MQMHAQQQPFITIDNEDDSYDVFVKLLMADGLLPQINSVRCHRVVPAVTLGNRLKRIQVQFEPTQGDYDILFNQHTLRMTVVKGEPKITTQCRKIEHIKHLSIYHEDMCIIKEFVAYVFNLGNKQAEAGTITIYQNNQGYWRISKQKKPRTISSVIFSQNFINEILGDIGEFISSEQWYTQMGIPFKRSYLLFGPPGTGKSSLAQAIAAEVKFSICFVNCSDKINDFGFNQLLNSAPKQSIILLEDVDAVFSQRKNVEKQNSLTFSGFLNAIDGVRSQQGRIIIMTTNYKERLDPALLRPGRVDEMYEVGLATKYQLEKMCLRFYKDQELADRFAQKLPEGKFSMSMIQGFLMKYRKNPHKILQNLQNLLQCDQNIKIDQFLKEINCLECLNDFKREECYTLATAKSLPKTEIQKIIAPLSTLHKGRLLETLRCDRKSYLKTAVQLQKYIGQVTNCQQLQRQLRFYQHEHNCNTYYQIKDKFTILTSLKSKQVQ